MCTLILRLVFLFSFSFFITSCTKTYVSKEALDYNKALAKYMKQEILLNAVRASKRGPLSFASVGALKGTLKNTAGISAELPFIMGVLDNYTLKPSYEGSLSDEANFSNLNIKEFYSKLQKELSFGTVKYYFDNDWPQSVLYYLFVQKIVLDYRIYKKFYKHGEKICARPITYTDKLHCTAIGELLATIETECDDNALTKLKGLASITTITFSNNGRRACAFHTFGYISHALQLFNFRPRADTKGPKLKSTKHTRTTHNGTTSVKIESDYKPVTNNYFRATRPGVPADLNKLTASGDSQIYLRSPEAMLFFMGELIAAQNYLPESERFDPKIRLRASQAPVELFNVVRGYVPAAVVSVTDDSGEVFSVPRPDYGSVSEGKTLTVMTLINQIIALQTQRDDIPQSSTVSVSPN